MITFPLLNLELNINKVAFTVLGVPIYWYAILIVASLALAIFLCKKNNGKYNIKFDAEVCKNLFIRKRRSFYGRGK